MPFLIVHVERGWRMARGAAQGATGLALAAGLLGPSCASIPRESVVLSREVGSGIAKSRTAHLATLGAFYKKLKADNDTWIETVFLPRAIENVAAPLAAACKAKGDTTPSCADLGTADVATLVRNTVKFRDEIQSALEANQNAAIRLVNDHYSDLEASKDATREATAVASRATGVAFDLDAIEGTLSRFLVQAGKGGAQVSELAQGLSSALSARTAGDGNR
jgi:tartrate dehydratase alpha subunit/fumarate hydratase class I-like protein